MDAILHVLWTIWHNYASVFTMETIHEMTNPSNWGMIGSLAILEGLLSADNALVLAIMVSILPVAFVIMKNGKQHTINLQKRALTYGLAGAVVFRFIFAGLGNYLTSIWWIKIIGALYLAYLVWNYFIDNKEEVLEDKDGNGEADVVEKGWVQKIRGKVGVFWGTVIAVELMDLTFSVDSILAAVALSDKLWVLVLGGVLGIVMMRGVASVFTKLIKKVPEMETTAFVLIGIIAVKMGVSEWWHMSNGLFFAILGATFLGTFVVHWINVKRGKHAEIAENENVQEGA